MQIFPHGVLVHGLVKELAAPGFPFSVKSLAPIVAGGPLSETKASKAGISGTRRVAGTLRIVVKIDLLKNTDENAKGTGTCGNPNGFVDGIAQLRLPFVAQATAKAGIAFACGACTQ